jgi:ABC-type multidrug transport system fused ATPase/permease subunit
VLEALTAVLIPLVIAYLIDGYLTPRIDQLTGKSAVAPPSPLMQWGLPTLINPDIDTIAVVTLGIVLLTMINSATDSMAEIYLAKAGRMLGLNLRVALYEHLQKLSLAFYGKQRTGDLLTRVTSDVTALEDFVTKSLSDIVGSILLIGFILFTIATNAWQVALMALVIIPVMALVSNYFSQRIKSASKKQRAREGDLAASAQEMLTSIRVIQIYGRSGNQSKRFGEQSRKTMESALEAAAIQARFSWVVSVLESVAVAAAIWLGVWLIFQSPLLLPIGLLVAFISYMRDMFKPTKKIIKEWNTFGKIYASIERIGEIFDRQPAVQDQPEATEAPPLKGHIAYKHVSFAYQVDDEKVGAAQLRLALNDVSFTIEPGQVVALVGGSGAGKSTIVQLLPRLYDPHAGQITIDGRDIREFTLDSLRAQMSMVLQEAILFTGSVAENIAYGASDATREQVIAAAMQANAHEFIEQLPNGYDTPLGERAANLSGGQRQRIAIARAFIRNTPILILDEPTTGLDAESADLVLLALRTLMKGKATIIISHDLNLIRHADTILVVKQGAIAQQGNHKALLKAGGLYADLYHKQFAEAVEERAEQAALPPTPAAADDEDVEPVTPGVFHTLVGAALPRPVTPQVFHTLLMQAVPTAPPTERASPPPPHANGATYEPPAAPSPGPAAAEAAPPPTAAHSQPQPAIFKRAVLRAVSEEAAPAAEHAKPAAEQVAPANPKNTVLLPSVTAPPQADPTHPGAPSGSNGQPIAADQLDPLRSPVLQRELPGLVGAFDAQLMLGYLQAALFGASHERYRIERCAPGKALYMGNCCALRYELEVSDSASGQTLRPLVVGRVFASQLDCAIYLRDKLAPLVALMRGRAEIAPFATPIGMIEPLNMAVSAFPIDGELPTLIGATDRARMCDIFAETLPEALTDDFAPQDCAIVPVNYARRHRCVLRYEIAGRGRGNKPQRRDVYGKVADDKQGALVGALIAALRERVLDSRNAHQFNLPRSLGFRPDLQLTLLEAIPGKPQISQLLKARLAGRSEASADGLTLEEALDACAQIAQALHGSKIALGRRRTLDGELKALQKEIVVVQHIAPELGARFQSWLERIETYAEESDPLDLQCSHGDYTYSQIIFDGKQSGLVDFDTICQAEAALDLGQFLAYLKAATHKAQKLASSEPADLGGRLGEHFLQAYVQAAGGQIADVERLRIRTSVYEAVSLMRMSLHSWQQLKPSRLANAIALLEGAVDRLPQLDY